MDKIFKDIVIIGGGAAGCYMSYLLSKQQISHVIITDVKSSLKYNLNHTVTDLPDGAVSSVRTVHGIGGGTTLWGGGLIELHESDFQHEFAYGSERVFDELKQKYHLAWSFFGLDRAEIINNVNFDEDICAVQKKPLNFADLISKETIIDGVVTDFSCDNDNKLSLVTIESENRRYLIHGKKFIMCAGTLGNLKILNQLFIKNDLEYLKKIKTGIYTHPKVSVRTQFPNFDFRLLKKTIDVNFKMYLHKILMHQGHRTHAIRNENLFVELLERFINRDIPTWILSIIAPIKNLLRNLYHNNVWLLNSEKFNLYKLYLKSVKPDYIWNYDSELDIIKLTYKGDIAKQISDLDLLDFSNRGLKGSSFKNITLAHTHYFGGLKLNDNNSRYITDCGRLEYFGNVWLSGPVILNATGYANPILSIVALSHVVFEDILKNHDLL